jgi:hypothetical protein
MAARGWVSNAGLGGSSHVPYQCRTSVFIEKYGIYFIIPDSNIKEKKEKVKNTDDPFLFLILIKV